MHFLDMCCMVCMSDMFLFIVKSSKQRAVHLMVADSCHPYVVVIDIMLISSIHVHDVSYLFQVTTLNYLQGFILTKIHTLAIMALSNPIADAATLTY